MSRPTPDVKSLGRETYVGCRTGFGPGAYSRTVLAVSPDPCKSGESEAGVAKASYLVDPASSHMLVSKIKPCMSKYKPQ